MPGAFQVKIATNDATAKTNKAIKSSLTTDKDEALLAINRALAVNTQFKKSLPPIPKLPKTPKRIKTGRR